jgi:glucokinase
MDEQSDFAIGVDIGGTNCTIGVVEKNGTVADKSAFRVNHEAGIDVFISSLLGAVEQHCAGLSENPRGIGVLLPGYLRQNRTIPYIMVNVPMLEGVHLHRILHTRFGVPVELDIDRNGPCLAEYKFRYIGTVERLMYVTIGTGVGVGLVVNGEICRVTNDCVGELGHVNFERDGVKCVCGNRGCVETIISRKGIGRIARRLNVGSVRVKDNDGKLVCGLALDILSLAAAQGDRDAMRVFQEFGRSLGAALVIYANIFSPDLIVVGGGLSGASEFFLKEAEGYLNTHWFERNNRKIPVRKTGFGAYAGVIGAASLVM